MGGMVCPIGGVGDGGKRDGERGGSKMCVCVCVCV